MNKHKHDLNRVEFYSKEDMAGGYHLAKAEPTLKREIKSTCLLYTSPSPRDCS